MARGTELAFRANDGIEVSLRWHRAADQIGRAHV